MTTSRAGLWVALAAVLVQGPRLVLTVLAADRILPPSGWTGALLVASGLGTALALTGGNIYLAHVLFTIERRRRLLGSLWLLTLVSTGTLVTPMIVSGLDGKPLVDVLLTPSSRWSWGVVAALAHELVAASCMLAAAAARQQQSLLAELKRQLAKLSRQQTELTAQLARPRRASSSGAAAAGPLVPCRNSCGLQFSVMGERAHQRTCELRPRKPMPLREVG